MSMFAEHSEVLLKRCLAGVFESSRRDWRQTVPAAHSAYGVAIASRARNGLVQVHAELAAK